MKKPLKIIGIFCTTLLTLVNIIRLLPTDSWISKKLSELLICINNSDFWSNTLSIFLIALGIIVMITMIETFNTERKKHTFKVGSRKYYKFFAKWYSQTGTLSIICDDIEWTKTSNNDVIYNTLVTKSQHGELNLLIDSTNINTPLVLNLKNNGANVAVVPSNIINNYSFSCISVMGNNSAVIVRNKQADEGTKIKFEEVSNNYITGLLNSLIKERRI